MSTRPHVEGEHPGWCRLGPSCAPSSERRPVEHCGSDFVLRPEHDDVRAEVTVRHDEDVLRGVDHGRTVVVLDLENEAFIGARADTRRERAAAARGSRCAGRRGESPHVAVAPAAAFQRSCDLPRCARRAAGSRGAGPP